MLTRKDFEAVAEVIKNQTKPLTEDAYDFGYTDAAKYITKELADYFATQNPQFNRERFMVACGLED